MPVSVVSHSITGSSAGSFFSELCEDFLKVWRDKGRLSRLATGFLKLAYALLAVKPGTEDNPLGTYLAGEGRGVLYSANLTGCQSNWQLWTGSK